MPDSARYVAGYCSVYSEDQQDGAAVFDMQDDGQPFCLIAADLCLGGKEGALARAKDIAAMFNKPSPSEPPNKGVSEMDASATKCPKCGLEAKTLLHRFCTYKECPVRDALAKAKE